MPRPSRRARAARFPQPTFLLTEPLKLAVRREGLVYQGPLELLVGPHRVEGGWWDRVGFSDADVTAETGTPLGRWAGEDRCLVIGGVWGKEQVLVRLAVAPTRRVMSAVRLGLRLVSGLREATATRIVQARNGRPFESTQDLALRAAVELTEMRILAGADALVSLSGHRRQQVWEASALQQAPALLREAPVDEAFLELEPAREGEEVVHDYSTLGLTLRSHPLKLIRPILEKRRLCTAADLERVGNG